jgi:hypothetical protein
MTEALLGTITLWKNNTENISHRTAIGHYKGRFHGRIISFRAVFDKENFAKIEIDGNYRVQESDFLYDYLFVCSVRYPVDRTAFFK